MHLRQRAPYLAAQITNESFTVPLLQEDRSNNLLKQKEVIQAKLQAKHLFSLNLRPPTNPSEINPNIHKSKYKMHRLYKIQIKVKKTLHLATCPYSLPTSLTAICLMIDVLPPYLFATFVFRFNYSDMLIPSLSTCFKRMVQGQFFSVYFTITSMTLSVHQHNYTNEDERSNDDCVIDFSDSIIIRFCYCLILVIT